MFRTWPRSAIAFQRADSSRLATLNHASARMVTKKTTRRVVRSLISPCAPRKSISGRRHPPSHHPSHPFPHPPSSQRQRHRNQYRPRDRYPRAFDSPRHLNSPTATPTGYATTVSNQPTSSKCRTSSSSHPTPPRTWHRSFTCGRARTVLATPSTMTRFALWTLYPKLCTYPSSLYL